MGKVAILIGAFPESTQTFIVRLAQYFPASVITNNLLQNNKKLFNIENVKICNAGHINFPLIGYTLKKIQELKRKITNQPQYEWNYFELQSARKFILENDIKHIVACFGPHGVSASRLGKELGIPVITYFLGVDASGVYFKHRKYIRDLKYLFETNEFIVVLNDWMAAEFMKLGCPESKIKKINLGVPTQELKQFQLRKSKIFKFISIGRFVEKKAPILTIKAFEECANKNPNVALLMIGEGELFKKAETYAKKSKHNSKIHLLGYKTQSEIKKIIRECHVFVQHSVEASNGDREGWPVAIAEACCYGLPVISTRHAGIVEQILHGKSGYLVEEYDYIKMGTYMCKLSVNPRLAQEMGEQARKYIESVGDIEDQIIKFWKLLN